MILLDLLGVPPLYWLVLSMMTIAVPTPDPVGRHGELATAITAECLRDPYAGDPESTASVDVALAVFESGLRKDAVGDGGHSVGAFQQYDGDRAILSDADLAVRTAHRMIRQSMRTDRDYPLAFYARGPRFRGEEARRLSRARTQLAARLLREARGLRP